MRPRFESRSPARARSALHRALGQQCVANQRQIVEQRIRYPDSHARGDGGPPRQCARAGVQQLLSNAGDLESIRLLGVQPAEAWFDFRQRLEISLDLSRVQEMPRRSASRSTDRCGAPRRCRARRGWRTRAAGRARRRDPRRDAGIAVAVAADPGAERERPSRRLEIDPDPAQLPGQLVHDIRDGTRRVRRGSTWRCAPRRSARAGRPQLVGLPQQVDHLGQPFLPTLTVGGVQQVGDAPQLGERAASCCLGGVRGEDGANGQPVNHVGDQARCWLGRADADPQPA